LKIPLTFLILFTITSCSTESVDCFKISRINISKECILTESVYFEITDSTLIKKLSGPVLVRENLEPKFSLFRLLKNSDTIDTNYSPRVKKSPNGIYLVYRTGRFLFNNNRDSTEIADLLKDETIEIELTDKTKLRLKYCD